MPNRRIELPDTVAECHKVILGLHGTLDEAEFRAAQLERQLYGQRRERFIDDGTTDEAETDAPSEAHPSAADLPEFLLNDVDDEPLLDSNAGKPSVDPSSADISSGATPSETASPDDSPPYGYGRHSLPYITRNHSES